MQGTKFLLLTHEEDLSWKITTNYYNTTEVTKVPDLHKFKMVTKSEKQNVTANFDFQKLPRYSCILTDAALTCLFFVSCQIKEGIFSYFLSL